MPSRRQFLQQASTAALACCSSTLFGRLVSAQAASTADQTSRIFIDSRRSISPLDRNLFGSFLEQLGRAIYEGIYDPASKLSDSNGFRNDVMLSKLRLLALVRDVKEKGGRIVGISAPSRASTIESTVPGRLSARRFRAVRRPRRRRASPRCAMRRRERSRGARRTRPARGSRHSQ